MPPKPRTTIPRPPPSSSSTTANRTPQSTQPTAPTTKRKRYIHSPLTLITILLLHSILHILAFILLTEPCLNPSYTTRFRDKLDYFSLLTANPSAIPVGEWRERFTSAGIRALFGVGVVQVWFTARMCGYFERSELVYGRLVRALKEQREAGKKVGVDTRFAQETKADEEEEEKVGSFIRQLESVSLTLLATPFLSILVFTLLILLGAPLTHFKQTALVSFHLTLLLLLPPLHILGLPSDNPSSASSNHWKSLLTLSPSPPHLLPLFYQPLFSLATTFLATAVLALDWNVSYQTYPFPLLVGSLIGLVVGNLYTVIIIIRG
ncbi:glycosylphosphatidylinositol anchor biosynthesis protein 11 [Pseudozyma hubeiensis SY62]|uniref:Glycosylphosphatidylinositol anchor biosynthesis protein 11 n=1 Tax=Pseudozyma hubeiensis (strain SY62) TaxID=1305764 RepID=R9PBQ5_PSEHS|nr:glycosylphosphatidylinositol anchor biosynthesis protein 11 [Pseudozyma hubeiensis SY62]GAC98779.1 glycosylphosphatidylinositol anchor biosynthesis protein 11 [Pseudozyma hubeiensis SY62]